MPVICRRFCLVLCLLNLLAGPVCAGQPGTQPAAGRTENILVFWTNGPELKAVTLMAVHPGQKPVGIVAIPVNTRIEANGRLITLSDLYRKQGRDGITAFLEDRFSVPIENYVDISQDALEQVSRALGPVIMNGKRTSLLDVFEGGYAGQRMDLQLEIRTLAARLIEPAVLVKVPYLAWLFSTRVHSNLGTGNVLSLYQAIRGNGPEILRKKALPGQELFIGAEKYREVSPDAWIRVLQEVTAS
ncbi:hypothetical protein [Desulfotomaculum copahuensis]|uniref:Cell envelope-related transcriptional attenuator domain-containing protein n=1 Tax=Desulfotomaculum copahuensis TaxID=1838280 RepID=A0A1B7LDK7_9FIRM|nr:hypothetical protein [Desulfotomaculum copahuensis]OAT81179.1 hypothetical protein A6M21_11620 [Desulfotomaculum copahuensis]